jgi:formiminotetrahydrofolate cyclodeaminase
MLIDKTVKSFLEELASDSPAPGGGSVAALCGSLASALCSMVCRLTIDKKKYEDVNDELKATLEKTEFYRSEFTRLIDEDTNAFNLVMEAYKLPKATDEYKEKREKAIEVALKKAADVPMEVLKYVSEMIEFSITVANKGNTNSLSDSSVATLLLQSAGISALYNIIINIKIIKDQEFVEQKRKEISLYTHKIESFSSLIKEISQKNFVP